jgi:hypothetical protein
MLISMNGDHHRPASVNVDHGVVTETHRADDALIQIGENSLVSRHVFGRAGVQVPRDVGRLLFVAEAHLGVFLIQEQLSADLLRLAANGG